MLSSRALSSKHAAIEVGIVLVGFCQRSIVVELHSEMANVGSIKLCVRRTSTYLGITWEDMTALMIATTVPLPNTVRYHALPEWVGVNHAGMCHMLTFRLEC